MTRRKKNPSLRVGRIKVLNVGDKLMKNFRRIFVKIADTNTH